MKAIYFLPILAIVLTFTAVSDDLWTTAALVKKTLALFCIMIPVGYWAVEKWDKEEKKGEEA